MQRRVTQAGRALGAMVGIVAIAAASACGSDKANGPDNTPATEPLIVSVDLSNYRFE